MSSQPSVQARRHRRSPSAMSRIARRFPAASDISPLRSSTSARSRESRRLCMAVLIGARRYPILGKRPRGGSGGSAFSTPAHHANVARNTNHHVHTRLLPKQPQRLLRIRSIPDISIENPCLIDLIHAHTAKTERTIPALFPALLQRFHSPRAKRPSFCPPITLLLRLLSRKQSPQLLAQKPVYIVHFL